jgi:hypothetical protein
VFKWKLRAVMAEKGLWSGQDLVQRLEERAGIILSHTAVMALVNAPPKAVRLQLDWSGVLVIAGAADGSRNTDWCIRDLH